MRCALVTGVQTCALPICPTPERPMAPSDSVSVPEYRTLLLTRQGRRLTITLNRPELLNACNYDMHEELADVFQFAHTDRHSDVIVVTGRSEEHTSELQSLMRISYAVFCLK